MTDLFGNEVRIGDECAFIEPYYHELNNGKVVNVTERSVIVEFRSFKGHSKVTRRASSQIICKR